ncbi:MAG: pyridinium-3,5-bisthiocarboxylic acid mononucleotide nickel chelatase [Solirubrobacteraceae bacterium]|nr:pyridinium-3,5-bisthiocarboxylic acid mononucleotide nickel chelatase [Solirubrobacteraceae bacterium]
MKTLYFDCFAGASGDMILGALVSAGVDPLALTAQLDQLGVSGWRIDFEKVDRSGISSTYARVHTEHEHAHRHLKDILKIINDSRLTDGVKTRAARIFSLLAEAEARAHNQSIDKIHFHEVGALDAIIDVCGAAIGFELLGIERFISSALRVGAGMIEMAHGRFPIPPPAVAELLQGKPIYSGEIEGEFVTPTGAAIISAVCESFGSLPPIKIEATGYGAGSRDHPKFPNALRILVGETEAASAPGDETLLMIETNIDDTSPQVVGYVLDRALEMGALDCFLTHTQMKKNRPGLLVSILCGPADREMFLEMLFAETTTIGARSYEVTRRALARETVRVETQFGPIDVKVAYPKGDSAEVNGGAVNAMPEFEQCRAAATAASVPLQKVQEAARAAYLLKSR